MTLMISVPAVGIEYLGNQFTVAESLERNLITGAMGILRYFIPVMVLLYLRRVLEKQGSLELPDLFRAAGSYFGKLIGSSLLAGILLLGLFLLFIVPGIIYSVYWSFLLYAVLMRDLSGMPALNYSKELVKGNWWNTIGFSLVLGLALLVGIVAVGIIPALIIELTTDGYTDYFVSLVSDLATVFSTIGMAAYFMQLESVVKKVEVGK